MGWKRFLVGEPMPDENDPKYVKRRERDMEAGAKFARVTGLTWLGQVVTRFAIEHKKLFLVIVFGIVILMFSLNTYRFIVALSSGSSDFIPVTERVDSVLQDRYGSFNERMK